MHDLGDYGMAKAGLNNVPEPYRDLVRNLLDAIKEVFGNLLVSVALYGSVARGEARADSDVDILIIAEDLPSSRIKRVKLFEKAEDVVESHIAELYGEGIYVSFSPIILTPDEVKRVPPILLDMVEDAIILYDKNNFFSKLLDKVASKLRSLGAERVRLGKKWYWRLKKDYRLGEVIVIE